MHMLCEYVILPVVLTAYELKIIIFPFRDGSQHLVNAVELQTFELWKEGGRQLDVRVLNLLQPLPHQIAQQLVIYIYIH